jgi:hypothetical protein
VWDVWGVVRGGLDGDWGGFWEGFWHEGGVGDHPLGPNSGCRHGHGVRETTGIALVEAVAVDEAGIGGQGGDVNVPIGAALNGKLLARAGLDGNTKGLAADDNIRLADAGKWDVCDPLGSRGERHQGRSRRWEEK